MDREVSFFWTGRLTTIAVALRDATTPSMPTEAVQAIQRAYCDVNKALRALEDARPILKRASAGRRREGKEGK